MSWNRNLVKELSRYLRALLTNTFSGVAPFGTSVYLTRILPHFVALCETRAGPEGEQSYKVRPYVQLSV